MNRNWLSRNSVVVAGALLGIGAAVLQWAGNPPNMGLCVACMVRDIAGALGLHRAAAVQYLRPEIPAIVLGAFVSSLVAREFRPRAGSAPVTRFLLGCLVMIGALVFLGCPWRAYLRLAGGDGNALVGILGLAAGVWAGTRFLHAGFSLGRSQSSRRPEALILPLLMLLLIAGAIIVPQFGRTADGLAAGPIFSSVSGPGSLRAPIAWSLAAGLILGIAAQRSRFCSVGAIRDLILIRDGHLFRGVAALVGAAFAANVLLGQFTFGFSGQPIAHTAVVWNFLSMTLVGLAAVLAGGCPGRQLVLAGEGDSDATAFVMGMVAGAAVGHNLTIAASPAGPGLFGPAAVIVGLAVCVIIGIANRE